MHPYEALLRASYAAFNAQDLAGTLKALGPKVEWQDQLEGVTLHGPDAVGAYWERQWAALSPQFELKHFELTDDDHVVLTLLQTLHGKDDKPISRGLVRHVYEFQDGLVRKMTVLYS